MNSKSPERIRRSFFVRWIAAVPAALCLLLSLTTLGAENSAATGSIEGRAFNPATGEYLENTRVTIEGTELATLTDSAGFYRLVNVPAGEARLRAFRTGLLPQSTVVAVRPGEIARHDINLTPFDQPADSTVRLSKFVVSSSKEMDGAAIAINEQRFASDIRNVIAANEFGPKGEGGIGELLQFVPGIAVDFNDGDQSMASLNGVPTNYVPVSVNGFDLASGRATTSREMRLNAVPTTYNISRIEVLHSPTPESPGSALAGSINVVAQSAFDRARPSFEVSTFFLMRDNVRDFNRTPGPGREPTRKAHPGANFSFLVPVNDRFGFTLSGGATRQYLGREGMSAIWRGNGSATNGGNLPDTTPDKPYLTQYGTGIFNIDSRRSSLAATLDYKLGPHDRISLAYQYFNNTQQVYQSTLTFNLTGVQPGGFGPTFTRGIAGAGDLTMTSIDRVVVDIGHTPALTYRHNGPTWKGYVGLGYSNAVDINLQPSRGMFFNTTARRTGLTLSYDDIFYLRPGTITVTDGTTGAPVDPYALESYQIATASYHPLDALPGELNNVRNIQRGVQANLSREFFGRVPFTLKGGLDVRENVRDLRLGGQATFTYVGVDGRPLTADDRADVARYDDADIRSLPGFGFPRVQWTSNTKIFDLFRSRPTHFTTDDAATHRAATNVSKRAAEVISAAFVRGDLHLFNRRLNLVSGVRVEQTNLEAEGPLSDPTLNYQRNAQGAVILSNGRPVPITSDPLRLAQLTVVDRGMQVNKEYLRFFPSVNASFNVRENLIARAAWYVSIGRPDFNQYAGGVTLPDTESLNPSTQRITVNNAAIKPWSARSTKVMLEYYFEKVGLLSVGVFRREIENFFGSFVFDSTPEFLALYDLDPDVYGRYQVATQRNLSTPVRMEGFDVNYKQALTFLPTWARGVQVFANLTSLRTLGEEAANFAGFVPQTYNWGCSVSREKFNLKLNWNYRGRNRRNLIAAGRSIEPSTYMWQSRQLSMNVMGEYYFHRRLAAFVNLNSASSNDLEVEGPNSPAYSQLRDRQQYGGLWTIGIKSKY